MDSLSGVVRGLRAVDLYPKTREEHRVRTLSGALLSIGCLCIISYLFVSELSAYTTVHVRPDLSVDTSFGELLRINIDVTFPRLPCAFSSIDAMDISGTTQHDITHNVHKQRLQEDGNVVDEEGELATVGKANVTVVLKMQVPETRPGCASCYGAERSAEDCCVTCADVRNAYASRGWMLTGLASIAQCVNEGYLDRLNDQKNEGCRYYGFLLVKKVQGNFHFAPGTSIRIQNAHTHDLSAAGDNVFNMSHIINRLSFGDDFPGNFNPLDSTTRISFDPHSATYSYYTKIVPTAYRSLGGDVILTNQYSVTEHVKPIPPPDSSHDSHGHGHTHSLPGVFVHYDLSPIKVTYTETKMSFGHFVSSLCAIIGGVFTVAGIIDSVVYKGMRSRQAKEEIGKFG